VKDIDCACPGNPTCNSLLPTWFFSTFDCLKIYYLKIQ
jgi:hypothetical protein